MKCLTINFLNNSFQSRIVQVLIDFNKWCLEEAKRTGKPKQMMCAEAVKYFTKFDMSPTFIRDHTDGIFKQNYRQTNAKKRDYSKTKIQRIKAKFSVNIDDFGVLMHESMQNG